MRTRIKKGRENIHEIQTKNEFDDLLYGTECLKELNRRKTEFNDH
jgi:hypothetical protein